MAVGRERLEVFQRAVAATCRAMAHRPALNVTFRTGEAKRERAPPAEAASVALPVPRRAMAGQDVARVRGEADGAALRLRHHDVKLHKRLNPQGELAGAVFDALEQIRVEALGASRMAGVAGNLASAHAARGRRPQVAVSEPGDAGLAEALELYACESLLGFNLPSEQREVLDAWRSVLDSRTGQDWAALRQQLGRQEDFAIRVREMLAHLGLAEDLGEQPDEQDPDQSEAAEDEQTASPDDAPGEAGAEDAMQQASSEAARERRRERPGRGDRGSPGRRQCAGRRRPG